MHIAIREAQSKLRIIKAQNYPLAIFEPTSKCGTTQFLERRYVRIRSLTLALPIEDDETVSKRIQVIDFSLNSDPLTDPFRTDQKQFEQLPNISGEITTEALKAAYKKSCPTNTVRWLLVQRAGAQTEAEQIVPLDALGVEFTANGHIFKYSLPQFELTRSTYDSTGRLILLSDRIYVESVPSQTSPKEQLFDTGACYALNRMLKRCPEATLFYKHVVLPIRVSVIDDIRFTNIVTSDTLAEAYQLLKQLSMLFMQKTERKKTDLAADIIIRSRTLQAQTQQYDFKFLQKAVFMALLMINLKRKFPEDAQKPLRAQVIAAAEATFSKTTWRSGCLEAQTLFEFCVLIEAKKSDNVSKIKTSYAKHLKALSPIHPKLVSALGAAAITSLVVSCIELSLLIPEIQAPVAELIPQLANLLQSDLFTAVGITMGIAFVSNSLGFFQSSLPTRGNALRQALQSAEACTL